MRPVKKYLMRLDFKSELEEEKKRRFPQYLLKIGRKISEILKSYKDPESVKEWRSNLWIFVSNFTEQNAKQLYKIYRQAIKDIELANRPSESKKSNDNMERKSILDTSPKQSIPDKQNSKHRSQQGSSNKRSAEDDPGRKGDRPLKKKYSDSPNDRKISERRDRYSNDYNKRDHYRNYSREEGNNFQRGKPHRDYPYPPDRHNNRYHQSGGGGYSSYGMRPAPYGMPGQPPPAHSGYNYGPAPPVHSPPSMGSQPPHHGSDHSGDSYGSYQGHADSWRRRKDHSSSSDHKFKN
nr:chromodomain-helicase-DNA-binding protein 1-like isoform X2 [Parasteatoda tepidariorum]